MRKLIFSHISQENNFCSRERFRWYNYGIDKRQIICKTQKATMTETKVLTITGHRPDRIKDPTQTRLAIYEALKIIEPSKLYQGMAAGVDAWTAAEAWKLDIPFHNVMPWAGHKAVDTKSLEWLKRNATETIVLNQSLKYPGPFAFEHRNRYMIDHSDIVLAVWDGSPKGGTFNAIQYARKLGKQIYRINPNNLLNDELKLNLTTFEPIVHIEENGG